MWYNNKSVLYVYAHVNSRNAYAIIEGLSGWKKIAPVSADGVTNVLDILKVAKANERRVNVFIESDDQIYSTYMI